jgi:hypothetical protein
MTEDQLEQKSLVVCAAFRQDEYSLQAGDSGLGLTGKTQKE